MSQRVGELFMLGFRGPTLPEWMHAFASEYGLGGVILFDYDCLTRKYERNVLNPLQVKELCGQIHKLPSRPLVFVDQEGGKVRRLKERYGFQPIPSAKQMGLLSAVERSEFLIKAFTEMSEIGIDVNLAPVIDVDYNPANPDIGAVERSYSADLETVRICAEAVAKAGEVSGLKLCLKHYPGCGAAKVNSHNDLMDLSDAIHEKQIQLFKDLLPRIPAVLFSHGIVNQWEPNTPVCLSKVAIDQVRKVKNEALVLTDDLQMEGLQKLMSTESACVRAVRAGADMLCIGNNLRDEQDNSVGYAQKLLELCESDKQMKENIEASIKRVQKFKQL